MKLAYLCNEYPPAEHGGIGTFIQAIARGMKTLGHTVTVVGIGRHKRVYDDSGVTVVTLPTIGTRGIAWALDRWRLNRWLSERVARREIDLIEAPEFGGMLPFGNPGCPVVIRLHPSATMIRALPRGSAKWSTVRYCERKTLKQNRNWIGVTDWMLNQTITGFGIAPVTSRVIYYPAVLAPATEPTFALPDHFVLYAGEVSQRKGACILARAASTFLREYPALHLVYAGALQSGVDIYTQIMMSLGKNLLDRVHFLGRLSRENLATCMRKATLFASPSLLESCSLVTIEAMLSGLPVIVPDAGPFPEFVTHNETGYLVAPNDPASLAAAVATMMDHPELRSSLGKNAQLKVRDRFSLSRCLGATEALYNQMLAAGGRPQ